MTPTSISYSRLRAILVGTYIAFSVFMVCFVSLYLWSEHRRLEKAATEQTGLLARALEEHVIRSFALIDYQLRDLGKQIAERGMLDRPGTPAVVNMLKEATERIGKVIAIYVFDVQGGGHSSSVGVDIRHLRASTEHVRNALASDSDELFIGRTLTGAVTGQFNIPVTLRILDKNRRLAGVIGSAIEPGYFEDFYKSLQAGEGISINLLRKDGAVLARYPYSPERPLDVSKAEFFRQHLSKEQTGSMNLVSPYDGRERISSFRHVAGFDLIVVVAQEVEAWVKPWRKAALTTAGVVLVFVAALLGLLLFALRGLKQHAESEEHYSLLVRGTNDGIWDWRVSAQQVYLSRRWYEILGYQEDELNGVKDPYLHFIHAEDRVRVKEAMADQLAGGDAYAVEFRMLHKDGHYCWVRVRGIALRDASGAVVRIIGSMTDITQRRNAEAAQHHSAIRIRGLLRRLVETQEAERRRFAADLHDSIGQNLSAIGIELETLRGILPPEKKTTAMLDEVSGLVATTVNAVRQVIADLRPALLDDYGLVAAIQSHAKSIEKWSGLTVSVQSTAIQHRPAPAVELALFRIAQEALMNAAKHSGASRASVALSSTAGAVRLCVEDNGRGIAATAASVEPGNGWGTAFMRERAEALGGKLSIEDSGAGTRIIAEIPYANPDTAG